MSSMMDNVKNSVMQAVSNKKFIMIIVLLALFIGLAFWVYTTYVAPKLNDFVIVFGPPFIANSLLIII